ncbi:hypothetical protein [Luteibacter sp. 621]|uniref:hypothetical protein n=1 Tax=Luteibacter sp. 621 TaxID=3373916 RepID=UPI003D24B555
MPILRNGAVLGLVFSLHIGLAAGLLVLSEQPEPERAVSAPTPEAALEITFHPRPIPPPRHPVAAVLAAPAPPVTAHPRKVRLSPVTHPAPSDAPLTAFAPPVPAPAPAPITEAAQPAGNPTSYAGGDPALRQALGESAHHAPAVPGFDAGSRAQGIVLTAPTSMRDTVNGVGTALSCNTIKMKRDHPGNEANAALMRAYDEMGCKG